MPRLAIVALATATCLIAASASGAAWKEPVGGPSPINRMTDADAETPSLTTIAGVPWVAWAEYDGMNQEIRVARLNAAGTDWEEVVGGASPINRVSTDTAHYPSIAGIGGVPHVAWTETASGIEQIRVARLNAAGTDWEELVGGASPINHLTNQDGSRPSLSAIDGRPAVAWQESDGMNTEIRVSRLNAAGTAWEKAAGGAAINFSGSQNATHPSLAVIGGVTHVAWSEHDTVNAELRVARQSSGFAGVWTHLGPGANPVNHANNYSANSPSLAGVAGVPHVAWHEYDGENNEMRVARLAASGGAWDEVVGGASPINNDSSTNGPADGATSLLDIGGTPFVAWSEYGDEAKPHVRVSRLNAAGTAWEQIVGGENPINLDNGEAGEDPSMTEVGGVPYVAWAENRQIRVTRLEPEFLGGSETATDSGATLTAQVRTFGVSLPVAFEHGPGSGFGTELAPVTVRSGNGDAATATATITGLSPSTNHSWRAFGTDLSRRTSTGPTRAFTTLEALPPGDMVAPLITGARAIPKLWYVDRRGDAELRVTQRGPVGRGTRFRYTLSEAARVVFAIQRRTVGRRVGRRCRKATRRYRARRRCTRFVRAGAFAHEGALGANSKRFSGRIGRKRLRAARYRAVLVATDGAGNRSQPVRALFRVVRG